MDNSKKTTKIGKAFIEFPSKENVNILKMEIHLDQNYVIVLLMNKTC